MLLKKYKCIQCGMTVSLNDRQTIYCPIHRESTNVMLAINFNQCPLCLHMYTGSGTVCPYCHNESKRASVIKDSYQRLNNSRIESEYMRHWNVMTACSDDSDVIDHCGDCDMTDSHFCDNCPNNHEYSWDFMAEDEFIDDYYSTAFEDPDDYFDESVHEDEDNEDPCSDCDDRRIPVAARVCEECEHGSPNNCCCDFDKMNHDQHYLHDMWGCSKSFPQKKQ